MRKLILVSVILLFFLTFAFPVFAQDEVVESNDSDGMSWGLGADWGGLGINYLLMDLDDPSVGFSVGIGYIGAGVGVSASVIGAISDDSAIFAGGGVGVFAGGGAGMLFAEYGNLPESDDTFLWRIGVGYENTNDDDNYFPLIGFGWCF